MYISLYFRFTNDVYGGIISNKESGTFNEVREPVVLTFKVPPPPAPQAAHELDKFEIYSPEGHFLFFTRHIRKNVRKKEEKIYFFSFLILIFYF